MQALLNLPPPANSLPSLHAFIDSIDTHIKALSSLRVSQDSYGTLLAPIIISKLPAETRRNMARDHTSVKWTVDDLKSAVLKELRIFETGQHQQTSSWGSQELLQSTASFHTSTDRKPGHRHREQTNKQSISQLHVAAATADEFVPQPTTLHPLASSQRS